MCAEARVQMKRRFRTAGTKALRVYDGKKKRKEERKEEKEESQLRANRRQFEPLNRKKIGKKFRSNCAVSFKRTRLLKKREEIVGGLGKYEYLELCFQSINIRNDCGYR